MTLRKPVVSVELTFSDGSTARYEGFEGGLYTEHDNWKEGDIPGKVVEKWVSHSVQWTTNKVAVP